MASLLIQLPSEVILLITEQIQSVKDVVSLLSTCGTLRDLIETSYICRIILKKLYTGKFGNYSKLPIYGGKYFSPQMNDHFNGLSNMYIWVWIEHRRTDFKGGTSVLFYDGFSYDITTEENLMFDQKKSLIMRIGPIKLPGLSLEMIWLLSNFESVETFLSNLTAFMPNTQNKPSPSRIRFNMADVMLFLCITRHIKYCWPPNELVSTPVNNVITKALSFTTLIMTRAVEIVERFIAINIKK